MIRLDVPFREKDRAKALGARWNYAEKFWYCEDDQIDLFREWYRAPEEPVTDGEGNKYETVSAINEMIVQYFDSKPEFQFIRVKGEVSNYSLWKGHHFFTIKDSSSVLKCILWEQTAQTGLDFELKDGQEVGLVGSLRFNAKRGEGELIVARVHDLGEGGENQELKLLKEKLQAEGLFDIEHKKPIPPYPKRIGIISSKEGDAIRDICRVAHDRNPYIGLFLYSVTVQGQSAPDSIIEGIRKMDEGGYDLLIISRGGGSREDLAPFDDERVIRAVYAANTPVVSGVGHERDWTLIDLVVDKRFSTPTYAAQGVIPDVMVDIRRLHQLERSMKAGIGQVLRRKMLLLDSRRERLERFNPEVVLQRNQEKLTILTERMQELIRQQIRQRKHRCDVLIATLNGRSPTAKLVQGFGYISRDEKPVKSVGDVRRDEELQITIHDGEIRAKVLGVTKKPVEEQKVP